MRNRIFKYLEKTKYGYLAIKTPCGNEIDIGDKDSSLKADMKILDWKVIDLCIAKGDIGLGQSYIENLFTTSDIENLLLFFCKNQKELEDIFHSNPLFSLFFNIKNFFNKNTLKGSKKNIEYHYDLGNDFYKLWLDNSMSYSSGIFTNNETLSQCQQNKYQRIINHLNKNSDKILEIGCGWGGFIDQAEKNDFQVKGLTLSHTQKKYSEDLIHKNNYKSKIHLQDYRHERGKYDNIVSIEMFEAVGQKYWSNYFETIKKSLNKQGKAIIQTITIGDDFFKKYSKTSDFIREYIFPGGMLPTPNIFRKLAEDNNLQIIDEFTFGDSYSKTLSKWLSNFNNRKMEVLSLGYDDQFIRKWQFYLAYCAAGFSANRTDVVQYVMTHD